jgi:hypothetical protein
LRRRKQILRQHDAHLSTQYLKKDAHSAVVIEPLELPNEIGKWACGDLYRLSFFQVEVEADVSFDVRGGNKVLYNANRDRLRLSTVHQEALDTEGAVDAPPAVAGSVDDDEDVARE